MTRLTWVALVGLVAGLGCRDTSEPRHEVPVDCDLGGFVISPAAAQLAPGDTIRVTAPSSRVRDCFSVVEVPRWVWTSSDTAVATVDSQTGHRQVDFTGRNRQHR